MISIFQCKQKHRNLHRRNNLYRLTGAGLEDDDYLLKKTTSIANTLWLLEAIDRPQAHCNSVYQYLRRWCNRGTLQKVLAQYGPELAPGWFFVDSTHVKVHADGSNPAGGQAAQAMGRTKGGLNTKIHAVVNVHLQAIVIALSSGNQADISLTERVTKSSTDALLTSREP
jgi:hypothetical protein